MLEMFDEFVEFCARMRQAGLRSLTVSEELYRRLQFDAERLGSHIEAKLSISMTIAGVDINCDKAHERMLRDIHREQMETYQAVKHNALADGMIEIAPGHFVKP